MKLYTIYDKKTQEFQPVFCAPNNITAMRSISNALRSTKEVMNLRDYPHDFALYATGEFNESNGHTGGYEIPQLVEEIANLLPDQKG